MINGNNFQNIENEGQKIFNNIKMNEIIEYNTLYSLYYEYFKRKELLLQILLCLKIIFHDTSLTREFSVLGINLHLFIPRKKLINL